MKTFTEIKYIESKSAIVSQYISEWGTRKIWWQNANTRTAQLFSSKWFFIQTVRRLIGKSNREKKLHSFFLKFHPEAECVLFNSYCNIQNRKLYRICYRHFRRFVIEKKKIQNREKKTGYGIHMSESKDREKNIQKIDRNRLMRQSGPLNIIECQVFKMNVILRLGYIID